MFARLRLCTWGIGMVLTLAGCDNFRPHVAPIAPPELTADHLTLPAPPSHDQPIAHSTTDWPEPIAGEIVQTSYQEKPPEKLPDKPRVPLGDRLKLPPGLPGIDAPVIELPRTDPQRKQTIDRHFPALPALEAAPQGVPGPEGKPLTLADLQRLARANSPVIRQAQASVDAARGVALQAGLYPNPRVGYEGDTMAQANSAGLQGGFIEQTLKTGHKLKLASAAAYVDVENAELALRRAEIDVATQVRRGYFAVLTARRYLNVGLAYSTLSTEIYSIQVARLRLGEATVYETLQARVLATQARAGIIQTRNRYLAEWRKLGAALGLPEMPLTQIVGDIDAPVPRFAQAEVLTRVLDKHTDILTAANGINRSRLALRLAEVQPIPDVDLRYMAQRDNTTPPFGVVHSVVVGVQMPVFNRNQGAIHAAQANLMRAEEEPARVRNELTSLVAAAFQRYDNARALTMMYRDQIVPDQVRAYRGIVQRYDRAEGEALNFNDIITSQQTMVEAIKTYLEAIGELWDSVVEVANLLQLDDLLSDGICPPEELDRCPVPELLSPPTMPGAEPEAKQRANLLNTAKVPLKVR